MTTAKELAAKLHHQTVLVDLSQLRPLSIDAALRSILTAATRTLEVERASFWSLAADGSAIRCVQLYVFSTDSFSSGANLARASYPSYFDALLKCQAIVANDAVSDPRTKEFATGYFDVHGIRAMLDVPVWTDGKLAGVLCLEHVGAPRAWTVDEEDFTRSIANIVALNLVAAERARAEERYRLVSRASGDVVWEWDLSDDRIDWGDRLTEALGHPITPETGTGKWWLEHVHPADRSRIKESVQDAIVKGRTAWQGEYRFARHDGTYAHVLDRGFFTYGEGGRVLRMTGALQDFTERRQLEERLLLSDRLASLGTLAAGVAHEINNPLTYVKGNIEHVRMALDDLPDTPLDVFEALDDAIMGADRMRRIVSDLAIFTRGPVETDTPHDLNRIVQSSLAMAQNQLRHCARVDVSLGSPPPVRGSEARIGQVVVNLLVNAAQAVKATGVVGRISVRTGSDDAGAAFLEIEDEGVGIASENLTRLFDPFFTTKPIGEGTGLGLSISHSLVRALGGEIHVASALGAGANFRVTLPGTELTPAPVRRGPTEAEARCGARPSVLIVDDEPGVRTALKRLLSRDFDVEVTDGGRAALARLSEQRFDVILCDLMMPDGSGADVYEALSARDPALARRLVFMTGGAFAPEARALVERAALPSLAKPLDLKELRRVITRVASDQASVAQP